MESVGSKVLLSNWQRKLMAVVAAIVVWVYVNQSITETKIIPNVAIRVMNLPYNKTIPGLLANGYISNRITLTLSGSKDVIQDLDQGDLEVLLDASTAENTHWVVQAGKKNLVSLNPSIDLKHHINSVSHSEFVITLSDLVSEKIPLWIKQPLGDAPAGYEFLDIWPEKLTQTLSGPKEALHELKNKGLKLTFDLSRISKEDLERLKDPKRVHDDEISFIIPEKWKQIPIPFRHDAPQEINDPDARHLRIDFLRKQQLSLNKLLPLSVFYPLKTSDTINPGTRRLIENRLVSFKNEIPVFTEKLFASGVSRLFLDIVQDNIVIVIVAAPDKEREYLQWTIEVIDPHEMEDIYVASILSAQKESGMHLSDPAKREVVLRYRFREYMQKLSLHTESGEKLSLYPVMGKENIELADK